MTAVNVTVENVKQAKLEVEKLEMQGYTRDQIYIFAHSKKRGEHISDALHTEEVGMSEQGFIDSMKNMFNSRGDELRNKMEAVGLSAYEADRAEEQLDRGRLVIIANKHV
ncbi:general stress protein [Paenibacillus assamensis]|uniref:general stress protein n=1 Tax=Paenibacillus assamensis TaxID=311244 RepID=UPI000410174C|nr:general stress protein [Paenibacillus assamensis]